MSFRTQSFTIPYDGTLLAQGLGDFNGDGTVDFIYGGPRLQGGNVPEPFGIVSIDAGGTLRDATGLMASVPRAVHAREIYVGDLNGDGRSDVFSANHGYDVDPFPGERNTLLLSGPDGRLADATALLPASPAFSHSTTGADIDGDGDIDLLVGVLGYYGTGPYILVNDGRGNLTPRFDALPAHIGSGLDVSGRFTSSLFVDINNDGHPDLVVGAEQQGVGSGLTYLNDGTGRFAAGSEAVLPPGLYGSYDTIVVDVLGMDVNRDGFADLVLSETDGSPFYQGMALQILINDRAGHFVDETTARVTQDTGGRWAQYLKAIDFNGDGYQDILAQTDYGRPNSQTVLWTNRGDGTFAPMPPALLREFAGTIVPLDFNGDHRTDFLSFSPEGGTGQWQFKVHQNLGLTDGLVDAALYYALNPDVAQAGVDAASHYATSGWREGRNPNPFFDTGAYLAVNRDVAQAGLDPLRHYHETGWAEGRDPSGAFDVQRYLGVNRDVAAAGIDPLAHFLESGRLEGRAAYEAIGSSVTNGFDRDFYLRSNADVARSGIDPYQHYLTAGWREGRDPNTFFDLSDYLAHNPDVAAARVDPLQHYMTNGWREGRSAGPEFDGNAYLAAYGDVLASGLNPLDHFLRSGYAEGRQAFGHADWS